MMTRKDYVAVANILKEYRQAMYAEDYLDLCRDFGKYMAFDNERFDAHRFLVACEIDTKELASNAMSTVQPKPASEHISLA
jgi:hypothetical protein